MELKITATKYTRLEISGITEFNDGSKFYWSEGPIDSILVKPDGTREEIEASVEAIEGHPYASLLWKWEEDQIKATRAEEIEWEMIVGNLSREQAEQNVDELDAILNG